MTIIKQGKYWALTLLFIVSHTHALAQDSSVSVGKPDVLFISIDDLSDWVGPLDGHPQALTPNLDRLAARGMSFTNAHVPAMVCNPARTAIMTGILPSNSGVYGNGSDWRKVERLQGIPTIPGIFGMRATGPWVQANCSTLPHIIHGHSSDTTTPRLGMTIFRHWRGSYRMRLAHPIGRQTAAPIHQTLIGQR